MSPLANILVVDDDSNIRFFLEELLLRDGYQVTCVKSGEEAQQHLGSTEFDLALIDVKLQGISGTQVLQALHEKSPDTIVIMLTGHGSLESAVEALRKGAHDYLFKPCKTVELRESIRTGLLKRQRQQHQRNLLQQLEQHLTHTLEGVRATIHEEATPLPTPAPPVAETSPAEQARFLHRGDLIIDMARHVITMNGQLLELSPTEFDLLAYLISEAPRVISPQELIHEVQGYESEPWEARDAVRYHIYRIRQKINKTTGKSDLIRTVRGVGYTINL